ncbi:hypothetical protein KFU94_31365 [Chloroflexi bacterium TSY]|nr:hypothetical protein [Chloroflexi bacterium TSY]
MNKNVDLSFERLMDWLENRLDAEEADQIAQIIQNAGDDPRDDLDWLQAFQQIRERIILAPLPTAVRSAVDDRFVEYTQQSEQMENKPGFFSRLQGTLTFDSALQPATEGIRSVNAAQMRQLIYSATPLDIAINLQPDPRYGHTNLLGQLLSNRTDIKLDQFSVQLLQNEREVGITMADELGEFRFDALQSGEYCLYLGGQQSDVELPPFEIR